MPNKQALKAVFIGFDGVDELDLIGPWEIFQIASQLNGCVQCQLVSEGGQAFSASKGIRVEADASLDDIDHCDILVMPGGTGVQELIKNPVWLNKIHTLAQQSTWKLSICTGALVYAAARISEGLKVTTHHRYIEQLKGMGIVAEVVENTRYIQDGQVISAAGVSAGMDMAFWFIGQQVDEDFSRQLQTLIEYDPQPPYQRIGASV